jgi:CRP/FNR family transcriptional regulator
VNETQVRRFLAESFFSGLSDRSLKELACICIPRHVRRREQLFYEGQEGHSLYVLARGAVQLVKTSPEGRDIVIKTLGPGEAFGEVILFEKRRYPVSAVSVADGLVLMIPRLQIDCLLSGEAFRRDFIAMLLRKQRYLVDRILSLTSQDVEERFFAFLREQYGERQEYRIELSKGDLAAAIGTIPETFSRLIQRLRREGVLQWEGKTLRLRDGLWRERERPA